MNELKTLTLNGKKYDAFVDPVARENGDSPVVPIVKIDVLDSDPIGEDLTEGRIWILKATTEDLTIPVIELGTVGENSIEIKLSNASFDGSGAVVETYRVYVNGSYVKSETIAAGGTYTVSGLIKGTRYQISVRAVKGSAISAWSNTLRATTAGEPDVPDVPSEPMTGIVYVLGTNAGASDGNISIFGGFASATRAVGLYHSGEKAVTNAGSNVYYPIPVPADATSCTIVCPGLKYGYCGWNLSASNAYSFDVDSGWKASGSTFEFEAGAAKYATISLSRTDGGTVTESDVANITVTFE